MKARKVLFKIISYLILTYFMSFISCEKIPCWLCEYENGTKIVCLESEKISLESQGYSCDPE